MIVVSLVAFPLQHNSGNAVDNINRRRPTLRSLRLQAKRSSIYGQGDNAIHFVLYGRY